MLEDSKGRQTCIGNTKKVGQPAGDSGRGREERGRSQSSGSRSSHGLSLAWEAEATSTGLLASDGRSWVLFWPVGAGSMISTAL